MPLGITWYTLEEAAAKYCLETALIKRWADEGVYHVIPSGMTVLL